MSESEDTFWMGCLIAMTLATMVGLVMIFWKVCPSHVNIKLGIVLCASPVSFFALLLAYYKFINFVERKWKDEP